LFFSNSSDSVVFSLNFIAIIPLAKLLGFGKFLTKLYRNVSVTRLE
jgi:hypothetical protein